MTTTIFSLAVTAVLLCFLSILTKCDPGVIPISKPLRHRLEDFTSMTMAYEEQAQIDCIHTSRQVEFSCGTKNFPCLCFAYANLAECFNNQINSHLHITYKGHSQHYCAQASFELRTHDTRGLPTETLQGPEPGSTQG